MSDNKFGIGYDVTDLLNESVIGLKKEIGIKHDDGKPLFSCIDPRALLELGKVAQFGAKRYGMENWRHVTDGRRRYWDAAIRHLLAARYEYRDPDSALPHLAHAAWNCLATLALSRKAPK